ncbi:calcium/proton exchanger [Candidatus Methylospira mobilis]|uniref:Ca(2+)/H(+) antiporter n=1 Tax=Candidatus Methylospira mobilis TaxID=1808979 RepID=A0A5Q0BMN7_9GAMM|nr:calcium/proton exchanger [Candidatus Methylospira mobilis]QFY43511.1 calcium/proton exchanger [Candidatus Methylospira mobilis]WNV03947.1 calcium/proton exchanger [Candidatus Methylospira mobilis]
MKTDENTVRNSRSNAKPENSLFTVNNLLFLAIPLALALRWFNANSILVFAVALLSIYPLAEAMAEATEAISATLGPTAGGLLNASLNNAPEIIIAMFALKNGLGNIVKASIVGSILIELLFGLGLAMFLGGLKHSAQRFNEEAIQINGGLLTLCGFGLIIPSIFHLSSPTAELELSFEISAILLLIYFANVGITLSRKPQYAAGSLRHTLPLDSGTGHPPTRWSRTQSLSVLASAALALAVMSEVITGSIEPTSNQLGLTPMFSGIILLAGAGGIGEIISATRFARNNNMDLAVEASVGSSIQMILLVVPLLIFSAPLMGVNMNLLFEPIEVIVIALTVIITRTLTADGRSTWIEGLMLLAVYFMLAIGFYYLPESTGTL